MSFKDEVKRTRDQAKKKIGEYLLSRDDIQDNLNKPGKSLDECFKFIMSEAKKKAKNSKSVMLTDEEVFGMAVHYYDEDAITFERAEGKVTVSDSKTDDLPKQERVQKVEVKGYTQKELDAAVKKALKEYKAEEKKKKEQSPKKAKKKQSEDAAQTSIFDFMD